ncbi:MAG: DNA alkylation repair protein [Verrucomicrobiales bacterium]|nr:DNA alkylation repair protein [Verrucomicrobiales bacterium]
MTAKEVLAELQSLGNPGTKKTLMRHGAREPLFGVKIGDMQKLRKAIQSDHGLALDLWDSGNYDAMYFSSLIAEDERMTKTQLRKWAREAYGASLNGSVVPSVAAGSPHGRDLAVEWIDRKSDLVASVGWSTLSLMAMVKPDDELDFSLFQKLLARAEKEIHAAGNESKYAMNHFVIATGSGIAPLFDTALATAESIGVVEIDHGQTACQTPFAPDYLRKVEAKGRVGKKKKSAKC